LKKFDREGYAFDAKHSDETSWVFRRRLTAWLKYSWYNLRTITLR
jgi:hypothetical protein